MAALGTLTTYTFEGTRPAPVYPVSLYKIHRGLTLGSLPIKVTVRFAPILHGPLATYVVRQIRILYRQLWPSHGQRFPQ